MEKYINSLIINGKRRYFTTKPKFVQIGVFNSKIQSTSEFSLTIAKGSDIRVSVSGSESMNLNIVHDDGTSTQLANGKVTDPSFFNIKLKKEATGMTIWSDTKTRIVVEELQETFPICDKNISHVLHGGKKGDVIGAELGGTLVESIEEWTDYSREEIKAMIIPNTYLNEESGCLIKNTDFDIICIPVTHGDNLIIEKTKMWYSVAQHVYGAGYFKNFPVPGEYSSKSIDRAQSFYDATSFFFDVPKYANYIVFNAVNRGNTMKKFDWSEVLTIKKLSKKREFVNGVESKNILDEKAEKILNSDKLLRLNEAATLSLQMERKDFFIKGVLFETGSKIPLTLGDYKVFIDAMRKANLNFFIYDNGIKWDSPVLEANGKTYDIFNSSNGLGEDALIELSSYARERGIELCLRGWGAGHISDWYTSKYPEILFNSFAGNLDIAGNIGTNFGLAFVEKFCKLAQRCGLKYHHISNDEWGQQIGFTKAQQYGTWGYADYVNKAAEICTEYGLIPIVWNDPVCRNESNVPRINKNISICMYNDKSMNQGVADVSTLQREGYNFLINSSTEIYYNLGGVPAITPSGMRAFDIHRFYGNQVITEMPQGTLWCIWPFNTSNYTVEKAMSELLPLLSIYGEVVNKQLEECNKINVDAIKISSTEIKHGVMNYADITIPEGHFFKQLINGRIGDNDNLQVYSITNLSCKVDNGGRWSMGNIRVWFTNVGQDISIESNVKVSLNMF